MYDFYLQEKKSINVWNLYSSGNIHSELSIILDNNNYFKLNRPLLIDSNIIELQPLNIDSIIENYNLSIKGIEITEEVQLLETKRNKRVITFPYENISETETSEIYDIEIKWIYQKDTISTFKIDSIDYLEEIVKRSRPETVYDDEEGYLKGWLKEYSVVFKSIDNNHYLIFSEILVARLNNITSNKPEIKEPVNGYAWSNYWSYIIEQYQIRLIK
ncbi:MAG: hypothetical protein COB15_17180 [Flavobacteriales bacterium]|nr:MAG: hypothetical protein COB15_17180 [Flavobacteriales bacterium]